MCLFQRSQIWCKYVYGCALFYFLPYVASSDEQFSAHGRSMLESRLKEGFYGNVLGISYLY